MVQALLRIPRMDEVVTVAGTQAKLDGSSFISEWHLLLSLLRLDSVRHLFTNQKAMGELLRDYGKRYAGTSQGTGGEPELPSMLQHALCLEVERLEEEAGGAPSDSEHVVKALFNAGSPLLRLVMKHFDYEGSWAVRDGSAEARDESFGPRHGALKAGMTAQGGPTRSAALRKIWQVLEDGGEEPEAVAAGVRSDQGRGGLADGRLERQARWFDVWKDRL